jgi:hypothetical protein
MPAISEQWTDTPDDNETSGLRKDKSEKAIGGE